MKTEYKAQLDGLKLHSFLLRSRRRVQSSLWHFNSTLNSRRIIAIFIFSHGSYWGWDYSKICIRSTRKDRWVVIIIHLDTLFLTGVSFSSPDHWTQRVRNWSPNSNILGCCKAQADHPRWQRQKQDTTSHWWNLQSKSRCPYDLRQSWSRISSFNPRGSQANKFPDWEPWSLDQ